MKYYLTDWIRNQKINEVSEYNVNWIPRSFTEEEIIKETEKAVQINVEVSHFGVSESYMTFWIPRSQIKTEEEYKKEVEKEDINQKDYYENKEKLQKWAKEVLGTRRNASEKTIIKKAHEMEIKVDENLLSYWGKQELKNIK